jgi:hypothetical protein
MPAPAWGSAIGALPLERAVPDDERSDVARALIAERVHMYAWAFDERRRDLLSDCFTETAVWHGDLAGVEPVPPTRGRDEIVAWLTAYWDRQNDQRRHFVMSTQIDDLAPTSATVVCSLLLGSVHRELSIALTSFYRMRLVLRDGSWLIDDLFEGGDVAF